MQTSLEEAKRVLAGQDGGKPIIAIEVGAAGEGIAYNLLVYVRTITESTPIYTNSVQLRLVIPSEYPAHMPEVRLTKSKLFHPNFTASGTWTDNAVRPGETFEDYLFRFVRVLQFKEINEAHLANRNAMAWYKRNAKSGMFPTDRINYHSMPRISVVRINHSSMA